MIDGEKIKGGGKMCKMRRKEHRKQRGGGEEEVKVKRIIPR
jgi:hypothetical protein